MNCEGCGIKNEIVPICAAMEERGIERIGDSFMYKGELHQANMSNINRLFRKACQIDGCTACIHVINEM